MDLFRKGLSAFSLKTWELTFGRSPLVILRRAIETGV